MTRRALRIRHYIGTIVTACTLGGLALATAFVLLFRAQEERAAELRRRADERAALAELVRDAETWLDEVREALGDPLRIAGLRAGCDDLDLRIGQEGKWPASVSRELASVRSRLRGALEGAQLALRNVRDRRSGEQPNPALLQALERDRAAVLEDLDPARIRVAEARARIDRVLAGEVDAARADVAAHRARLWTTAGSAVLAYAVFVLVLWHWVNLRFLRPLQALTRESHRTQSGEAGFHLLPDGPFEVRQLTESVSTLVTGLVGARANLEEKVRERTRELERANRAKNEFLANMSHEIRTPMTAILGYAELCLAPDIPDVERLRYAGIIHTNGEHLLSVINDILDVSKIEAGHMTVEPTLCSPFDVVSEVHALMEIRARAKSLELSVESSGPIPEVVRTDPTRLRQILLNLVNNAIKFTETGRVVLRFALAEDGQVGPRLVFDVEDTGVGLLPEERERIFHPFVQVDTSSTRKYGGSGLGLTISRTLAHLLGGDLTCTSEPGRGSTFRLTIDPGSLEGVRRVEASDDRLTRRAREPRHAAPGREGQRGRVLLAEDVAVNRRLIATLLARADLAVEEAENGRIALEKALAARDGGTPFDIVFMDMQMPEMDGYEATRALRKAGYAGSIVALTSHSMSGERERCLEAGCDEYMTKPVDQLVLLKVLTRYLPAEEGEEAA